LSCAKGGSAVLGQQKRQQDKASKSGERKKRGVTYEEEGEKGGLRRYGKGV